MNGRPRILSPVLRGAMIGGFLFSGAFAHAGETIGPGGEKATPSGALTLSDSEVAKLKAGKYTAALLWHTSSDFVNA
jgi:ribose transport system substrate-binding protein